MKASKYYLISALSASLMVPTLSFVIPSFARRRAERGLTKRNYMQYFSFPNQQSSFGQFYQQQQQVVTGVSVASTAASPQVPAPPAPAAPQPAAQPTAQLLVATIKCESSQENCEKVRKGFEGISNRISYGLKIKNQISVLVNVAHFCATGDTTCHSQDKKILASAKPNDINAREDSTKAWLRYPQALVKQMRLTKTPIWHQYDIEMKVNMDNQFWFKSEGTPINSTQYDFEMVVIHELIHGFGVISSWKPSSSNGNHLIPTITQVQNSWGLYKTWLAPTIFDRFIYSTLKGQDENSLVNLMLQISKYDVAKDPELKHLGSSPAAASAETAYRFATDGAVTYFKSSCGNQLLETSSSPFKTGTSLSHFFQEQNSWQPDFIMSGSVTPFRGRTLDDVIKSVTGVDQGPYNPVGPKLTCILQDMGWSTPAKDNNVILEVA